MNNETSPYRFNPKKPLSIITVIVLLLLVILSYAYIAERFTSLALPLPNYLHIGAPDSVSDEGTPSIPSDRFFVGLSDFKLDFEEIRQVMGVLDEQRREAALTDLSVFQTLVEREAINKSLLAATHANDIDAQEKPLFLAQRAFENTLRDIYLRRLIGSQIPEGFPSEAQMKAYYEENKDKFVVADRLQVWQVFLPFPEEATVKDREEIKKKAESIANDLQSDKLEFSEAVTAYSLADKGKYTAGYLGLIKVEDIKKEIREPLLALKPGEVSNPVITEEGMHILRRGNLIPEQRVDYQAVSDKIRELLQKQMQTQLRQTIDQKARETYPQDLTEAQIEEWWLKLRALYEGQ